MNKKFFITFLVVLGVVLNPIIAFSESGDTYTNKSGFWDYYEIQEIFKDGPVKEEELIKVLQEEGYKDSEIEIMLKEGAERESKVVDREEAKEEEEQKEETTEETTEEETEPETEEEPVGSLTATIIYLILFIAFVICFFSL